MATQYDICLIGPSRSGKTTLIASAIEDFKTVATQLYSDQEEILKLEALADTYGRVADRMNLIKSATAVGSFDTGCLTGTQSHEEFHLGLAHQKKILKIFNPNIELCFHDFPGGWISNPNQRESLPVDSSEILILPIDASLVMEAASPKEVNSARCQLHLSEIQDIAEIWANNCRERKNGLFILAPVKCETYFCDNMQRGGFRADKSKELFMKITDSQYYGEIIDRIKTISPQTKGYYIPIDTVGCCFISQKSWDQDDTYGVALNATYTIPHGASWKPYGPAHIMLKIVEYLIRNEDQKDGLFSRFMKALGFTPDLVEHLERFKKAYQERHHYKREVKLF